MRYGDERVGIRPDTHITSLLAAIHGVDPVQDAQDVATRVTALWQPRAQDALRDGLGERTPGLLERFRLWRYTTTFRRALRARGLDGVLGWRTW